MSNVTLDDVSDKGVIEHDEKMEFAATEQETQEFDQKFVRKTIRKVELFLLDR